MKGTMEQCCCSDGKPDFDMMKQFMEHCGKDGFTDDDMRKMREFCSLDEMPDMAKMKQMMESCGCQVTESAGKE